MAFQCVSDLILFDSLCYEYNTAVSIEISDIKIQETGCPESFGIRDET